MIELRWTTKKTGLVLQYRTVRNYTLYDHDKGDPWTEWTDVADVDGDVPRIEPAHPFTWSVDK